MKTQAFDIALEGIRRILYILPDKPKIAQIEVTNVCNFDCAMCQRIDLGVELKDMQFDTYKKVIDKLDGIKEVILTGWGEPFVNPNIFGMIDYAKSKGLKVKMTTNGSLLHKENRKKIFESDLDDLYISLDDIKAPPVKALGHPMRQQLEKIETLLNERKVNRNGKPKVVFQTTLHKGLEKKIFEIVEYAGKVGADMVNVNRLDLRFNKNLIRPNFNEEKKFAKQLDEIGKEQKVPVEFRPHLGFGGIVREIYKIIYPLQQRGGRHCLKNYNYIYVNLYGQVTPCCAIPTFNVGDILSEDILKIWKSKRFSKFRNDSQFQRKVCNGCDVLEIYHQI